MSDKKTIKVSYEFYNDILSCPNHRDYIVYKWGEGAGINKKAYSKLGHYLDVKDCSVRGLGLAMRLNEIDQEFVWLEKCNSDKDFVDE